MPVYIGFCVGVAGVPLVEPCCSAGRAKSPFPHSFSVRNMNKTIGLPTLLILTLLVPTVAAQLPADQNGGTLPFASPMGIVSPINGATYTSGYVTLNVSQTILAAANIHYSIVYRLDGQANESVPLTTKPAYEGSMLQGFLSGTVDLPRLSDGVHRITVYETIDVETSSPQHGTTQDTVYFTVKTATAQPFFAANLSENTWTTKAPIPTARFNFGTAVVNGVIYAIGGSVMQNNGNHYFTNTTYVNEAYDPATDTWTEKAPLPTPLGSFALAVYEGKIYCFGGETFVYDPAADSWETKPPMLQPENGVDAHFVDGKIYVIGNLTQVYDPAADSWATKTPIPTAVSNYASVVMDGKIYVVGGNTVAFTTILDLNQIYDPVTDTWSQGAPILMGVSNAAAAATVAPKAIYVLGGSNQAYPLNGQNVTQVYFPENNSWTTGGPMPKDNAGLSVAVVDGVLYAIGGGHNIFTPDSTDNMQYTPLGVGPPEATSQPPPASPSLSPTPSPTASPSPSPSPNTTTQPSQTVESTPSPTQPPTWSISGTQTLFAIAAVALVAVLAAAAGALRKRRGAVPVGEQNVPWRTITRAIAYDRVVSK